MEQSFHEEEEQLQNRIAELTSEISRIQQERDDLEQARTAYDLLVRRHNKEEKLPRHLCTNILPYRYSKDGELKVRLKAIPIAAFVSIAKYLTKTDIDVLSRHETPLLAAVDFLGEKEKSFPLVWYRLFEQWSIDGASRDHLRCFFKEATDAIKVLHHLEEPNVNCSALGHVQCSGLSKTTEKLSEIYTPNQSDNNTTEPTLDEGQSRKRKRSDYTDCRPPDGRSVSNNQWNALQLESTDTALAECTSAPTTLPKDCETNCGTSIDTGHKHVKYTLAYLHKAELAKFFSSTFITKLEETVGWGGDRTTSCIRVQYLEDGIEFVIDWGHPTMPSAEEVFRDTNWGIMSIKQVTQLSIKATYAVGQTITQSVCFPETLSS